MNVTLIIVLFFISLFDTPQKGSNNDFYIYYSIGSGWTGRSTDLEIFSNGNVIIDTKFSQDENEKLKPKTIQLTKNELDSISKYLKLVSKIKLKHYGFGDDKPTDYPTTFLKYKFGSISDSTSIYCPNEGEMPKSLELLLSRITTIVEKNPIQNN